jgi:hypothetical protein
MPSILCFLNPINALLHLRPSQPLPNASHGWLALGFPFTSGKDRDVFSRGEVFFGQFTYLAIKSLSYPVIYPR